MAAKRKQKLTSSQSYRRFCGELEKTIKRLLKGVVTLSLSKRSQGTASALLSGTRSTKVRLRARRLASAAPCKRLQLGGLKRIGFCNPVNGYVPYRGHG